MRAKPKPTIKEIASQAGVSAATASYALSGKGGVGESTRQRVLEVAAKMGYPVRPQAKAPGQAMVIGVMYPGELQASGVQAHDVYSSFVRGIQDVAGSLSGYVVTYAPNVPDSFLFNHFQEQGICGLLFLGTDEDHPNVRAAQRLRIPIVLLNHHGGYGVSSVCVANRKATHDLVEHLIEQHGCSRFFFVQPEGAASYSRERLRGCRDAAAEHDLPDTAVSVLTFPSDGSANDVHHVVEPLLKELGRASAAVVDRDLYAAALIEALQQRGVSLPDDLRVVGFDDLAVARRVTPALTTVRFDAAELARKAMSLLLSMSQGEVVEDHLQIPYELIIRGSCGCDVATAKEVPTTA